MNKLLKSMLYRVGCYNRACHAVSPFAAIRAANKRNGFGVTDDTNWLDFHLDTAINLAAICNAGANATKVELRPEFRSSI